MKILKYGDVYKLDYDRLPLYGTVCGRDGDAPIIVPMTTDTRFRDPNSVNLIEERDGLTAVAWPYLPIRISPRHLVCKVGRFARPVVDRLTRKTPCVKPARPRDTTDPTAGETISLIIWLLHCDSEARHRDHHK